MKCNTPFFLLIIFATVISCNQRIPASHTLSDIETAVQNGQLKLANQWADSLLNHGNPDSSAKTKLAAIIDMNGRIKADFTLTVPETEARLQKEFFNYSQDERVIWEKNNWLEYRTIDGEKRYFKRAISNLKLILQSQQMESRGFVPDKSALFNLEHSRKVIAESKPDGKPVVPVNMKVTYQLTVDADAVPNGKMVRCWLPWPREVHDRQRNVALIKTVPETHIIAPDSAEQRSVYLEQIASKGKPVVFEIQFTYQSSAQYFDLNQFKILPYDTTSLNFKKYTGEQHPQIVFTNEIKKLSDSIVGEETNPAEKVRKLYYWINNHVIWTGALEYSIMPFIPGYVLKNRRGDCGMQTLLFMTMARYQKIPVKWQSGWMMHPNEVNLHDWCEVYYNGAGWVPLDMSFNLQNSDDLHEKEFYISGIDAYRMIVNDAIGSRFVPEKKFPRSEPYDFQRGEVEWDGGNLYFNQWDYQM
ncbi:MAG: transglutaminase domain-containing protein, partial [Mariniphaga sp.]|nr:transglutaminase domain-containing protein [Mariniphaga sp.]